ncbi:adenylyltransferase and sulfurtransferase [Mucilaginibacter lappiensis]|uniref:Adenylyltransferase/sulfurtransferase n=1 Tax=Mucilaginibacter lappiensis TaxID=354630 RepID=A0ABR6PTJ4_9SPHI|nr:rhodanese-like domain-containing protein [Mucilaginibacter lappiensis]MBB6113105.1 adenylyltransferase/sulfurtransferase [Mucilaginibacter lappiensis]SIS12554.1 adenylyltransferase and sulfurtransferase [Mucilaginibacter lappiensis]
MPQQIDATELLARLNNGEQLNLVDVRGTMEYHTYNIGGLNIPLLKLEEVISDWDYNKTDEIIVICKVGLRSKTAQTILQQNGYLDVKNLSGGLIALQKLK